MAEEDEPERHINIHFSPEIMAGVYANFANVSFSDYEFTITFARVDHEIDAEEIPGVVVSRVNLSPKFMRELADALEDSCSKWATREGIKNLPEFGGGAPRPPTSLVVATGSSHAEPARRRHAGASSDELDRERARRCRIGRRIEHAPSRRCRARRAARAMKHDEPARDEQRRARAFGSAITARRPARAAPRDADARSARSPAGASRGGT